MGRPKALLPIAGETFIRRIVRTLRNGGVTRVAVVVRPGADEISREAEAAGAEVVVNPDPDRGQLSSLQAALDVLDRPEVDGIVVTLVDVPLVREATIAALLARARVSDSLVLRTAYQGRHGHPVIFKRAVFEALRQADPADGAKAVVRAHASEDVQVDDPGTTEDVDTPDDYTRLIT
jgi:CTP:molybdopterin cytidylyltransferase MocA